MSTDYPGSQGGAAIGARLRRLSDRIDREADRLYRDLDQPFQQRWYGVVNQLHVRGPLSVSELAAILSVTHAAVSQARAGLAEQGLIVAEADPADSRRRTLALSPAGLALVERLGPFWRALNAAAAELDREAGAVVEALGRLEAALDRRSLVERVREAETRA